MIGRVLLASCVVFFLSSGMAAAQTQIGLSATVVSPGQSLNVMVSGGPGQFFAVIGSSVNGGFSYAGVPLGVGNDVVILSMGTLDGYGNALVSVAPPFNGTILDRYYLQAATSTAPDFIPLQASAVGVVRNGDLVAGLTGPAGPQGPPGPQGLQGAPGPPGPPGLSDVSNVQVGGSVAANATGGGATASCPVGTRVVGGGAASQDVALRMYASRPAGSSGWSATFVRDTATASSAYFQVYAICATVGS